MPKSVRFSRAAWLAAAEETRCRLLAAAETLPPAAQTRVFLGTWSAGELLAHLAGWDKANLQAIAAVRRGELPDFYAFAERSWKTFNERLVAQYRLDDFGALIESARESHRRLVAFAAGVPEGDFERDFGVRYKGYRVTIARLLLAELEDEREHLAQIEAFAAGNS